MHASEVEFWSFIADPISDDPHHHSHPAPQPLGDVPPAHKSIASTASSGKNPWVIHSPLDACRFFGPLLSLIVVTQICSSILISRQLKSSITEMTSTSVAAIIIAAFLLTDASLLVHLRGSHFKKFTPWLAGLLLVSVCICIGLIAWNRFIH